MEKKTFTIYNIAEATNVSPATVSRVLNGNYLVSRRTREKVMAKIYDDIFVASIVTTSLTSVNYNYEKIGK